MLFLFFRENVFDLGVGHFWKCGTPRGIMNHLLRCYVMDYSGFILCLLVNMPLNVISRYL
jgi:hypothetical protein